MHQVYGGVTKLILTILTHAGEHRVAKHQEEQINNRLLCCKRYWPNDFQRKPEVLTEVSKWKCTQYRFFLLYLVPIILNGIVSTRVSHCFMYLHTAIRILSCKNMCKSNVLLTYSRELLQRFVENFQYVFGRQYCTYNVHSLLHLVDDVEKFGPLETFSAFRFENYLRSVSAKIKPSGRELQQLGRRMSEQSCIQIKRISNSVIISNQFPFVDSTNDHVDYYKSLKCEWHLIVNGKDNYVLLKKKSFVKILAFFKQNDLFYFVGKQFTRSRSAFVSPIDSKTIFRYCEVTELCESKSTFLITDIQSKCIFLDLESKRYLIPLLPRLQ